MFTTCLDVDKIKLPPVPFSLRCEDVNQTQGWFPVGTDHDGQKKIGLCYYEPPPLTLNESFGWKEAKEYCEQLEVPSGTPRADLPKMIYEDFIGL